MIIANMWLADSDNCNFNIRKRVYSLSSSIAVIKVWGWWKSIKVSGVIMRVSKKSRLVGVLFDTPLMAVSSIFKILAMTNDMSIWYDIEASGRGLHAICFVYYSFIIIYVTCKHIRRGANTVCNGCGDRSLKWKDTPKLVVGVLFLMLNSKDEFSFILFSLQ